MCSNYAIGYPLTYNRNLVGGLASAGIFKVCSDETTPEDDGVLEFLDSFVQSVEGNIMAKF